MGGTHGGGAGAAAPGALRRQRQPPGECRGRGWLGPGRAERGAGGVAGWGPLGCLGLGWFMRLFV